MQACCSYFMLGYTTLTVTNPFSMSRSEKVEENCKKAFFGEETRAPTKVVLALELISTIVRPKGQVLDPPMKAVDALFVVNIENVLNEKSNLFISFFQVWSYTCMGHTTYTIQVMIPEVDNQDKENSFRPNSNIYVKSMCISYVGRHKDGKKCMYKSTCHSNQTVVPDDQ